MQKHSDTALYLRLLSYIKPHAHMFILGVVGLIIFAATQPLLPLLLGEVTDAIASQDQQARYIIPLMAVGIICIRGIGTFLGNYGMARVAFGVIDAQRKELFHHLTILPNHFFDEHNSGDLISRITFDTLQVNQAVTEALKVLIREGATVIALLSYLLWLDWRITLVFLLISPILGFIVSKISKRLRKLSTRIQNSMGEITHICSEMINNFRIMRIFGGEAYENQRFTDASRDNFKQNMKLTVTTALATPVTQFVIAIALAVVMFLALSYMQADTGGQFIAYLGSAFLIPRSVRQLTEVMNHIQKGIAASESIFAQMDALAEKNIGTCQGVNITGELRFNKVLFTYPNEEKPALNNISFTISAGDTIALVGRSGSGKTTLVSLLPRFYNVDSGSIRLDDRELSEYDIAFLRQQISLVNQNITLFNDTLSNNIAYGDMQGMPEEKIIAAAKQANAWEFIEKMPNGLQTVVGENGTRLSGGQRQRIAIARALLKDAPILILDEATSALDTESERYIQEALETASQGRTTIVIAHRLTTIENADRILVMDQGHIVEEGTHKALIEANGYYAKLHQQGFSEEAEA
ncbi:MAG: subfamily B ATP-binding cassette protein MsbA [Kiritimatiellia bacterium]|jgi:subfamily B ATP-binding cassette protein MsbA